MNHYIDQAPIEATSEGEDREQSDKLGEAVMTLCTGGDQHGRGESENGRGTTNSD